MRQFPVELLTGIAAPAMAVALSPIPVVIALVLLIHNARPRASALAYLAGRAAALGILGIGIASVPGLIDAAHRPLPRWTNWVEITLGVICVLVGILTLRRGPSRAAGPRWHSQIGGIPPAASAGLGLLPPLANPKVIAAVVTADHSISGLNSTAVRSVAVGVFVVLACSTVAAPIVAYFVIGPRVDPKLEHLRHWIQRRHHVVNAFALVLIGVVILLYKLI